jgi:shikimate dehydrogenase
MRVQATSRVLAVIGDPVAHSLSPAMHNAAIAALGLEAVYVALRPSPGSFAEVVRGLLAAGGACNVTVPFKRDAAALLAEATPAVKRTSAANTLWGAPDAPSGDNTDVAAVRLEARALTDGKPVRRALVLGTGGSSHAAAVAVADEWPQASLMVLSRDEKRAAEFRAWAAGAGVPVEESRGGTAQVDLLINATPLGLDPSDPLPLARDSLEAASPAAVLDLVYAPGETTLVREARRMGSRASDGRGVLVAQGAAAFERFFGLPAPREIMRAAVEDALRA